MSSKPTLLVTGAAGQLGRQVVDFLLAGGASSVIAGSRDPKKLSALVEKGVETRALDFEKPETLASAFVGVDRALIISTDALDRPGRRVAQHRAAIDAAVKAGVRHLVYTSIVNAVPSSAVLLTPDHVETEAALAAAPIGFTILRDNPYADNLLGSLPHALATGQWFTAGGNGKASYVTRVDVARAAAAALRSNFDGKRTLDIAGPESLTHAEVARIAADVAGRPLTHVAVDERALIAGMTQAGLPEAVARIYASFDVAQSKGEFDVSSKELETLIGQKPMTLRAFLAANKAVLVG